MAPEVLGSLPFCPRRFLLGPGHHAGPFSLGRPFPPSSRSLGWFLRQASLRSSYRRSLSSWRRTSSSLSRGVLWGSSSRRSVIPRPPSLASSPHVSPSFSTWYLLISS